MARKKTNPDNTAAGTGAEEYTAAGSLVALEGLDGVRKRPAMYLGSADSRGLTHCVYEIFDNAVDEALAGHCTHITVTAHGDGSVSVTDNGRGIPTDIEPRSGLSGIVLVMTKLHAGGKFGGSGYKVSGGLHGVGASVVNAVSERVDVTVRRDGAEWAMSFRRGEPGRFKTAGPGAAFTAEKTPWKVGRSAAKNRGTTVRFWPDFSVFAEGSEIDVDAVVERARTTAYLIEGLTVAIRDERHAEVVEYDFSAKGGAAAMAADLAGDAAVSPVWSCRGTKSFATKAQVVGTDGKLEAAEVSRDVEVDVALVWTNGYEYENRSFVNIVATPGGGTHVSGTERAVVRTIVTALGGTKLLRANEEAPIRDDVLEGLVCVVAVRVPEPEFEGQTKEILGTAAVAKLAGEIVAEGLAPVFGAPRLRPQARAVLEKVVAAARARRAAREKRDAARKSKALVAGPLPAKLRDCRRHDEHSELLIVEGDSAAGSVGAARDGSFQAYLPIRGKILNTAKATEKAMLENAECSAILAAIGAGSGTAFDLDRSRYGKVLYVVDADIDGSHIRCLLLTLFAKHLRPLIDAGRVYAAVPPLYRFDVSDGRGKVERRYCYSERERDRVLAEITKAKRKIQHVQRYKGLGEMNASELAETTIDPASRHLRRITAIDVERANDAVQRLMGDDASARRSWIVDASAGFDLASLDI